MTTDTIEIKIDDWEFNRRIVGLFEMAIAQECEWNVVHPEYGFTCAGIDVEPKEHLKAWESTHCWRCDILWGALKHSLVVRGADGKFSVAEFAAWVERGAAESEASK